MLEQIKTQVTYSNHEVCIILDVLLFEAMEYTDYNPLQTLIDDEKTWSIIKQNGRLKLFQSIIKVIDDFKNTIYEGGIYDYEVLQDEYKKTFDELNMQPVFEKYIKYIEK